MLGVSYHSLANASLNKSNLSEARFRWFDFSGADLREASFHLIVFDDVYFTNANLAGATLSFTTFANVDLSKAKGLEEVNYGAPSTIGIDTIFRSRGKIPESFLRGCGVPQDLIDLIPSLTTQGIQLYSCFISHSSADKEFADRLYADLQAAKIRTWYAPEDLKIGDKIIHSIDRAVMMYDKLLLVLSEASIESE
jgi:uncharacterized protein YjbI with pentapeptide repeats